MTYMYLACLLISLSMLFWLKIYDVRSSLTQYITMLVVIISNFGYYFLAVSKNLDEAILAQKIVYVGGIFLPVFYFMLVLEICHIEIRRFVSVSLLMIQCVIYGFVCTIGINDWFYKSIDIVTVKGVVLFKKTYGPLHALYPVTMYMYLIAAFAITIYTLSKKNTVYKKGVIAMLTFSSIAAAAYAFEKTSGLDIEIIPIMYVVLMFGTIFPVYDSNVFTVYENTEIINEQLGKVGFLTFDLNKVYKGCNNFMSNVFPELLSYNIGQKIDKCSDELYNIIGQINNLEENYKKNKHRTHVHIHLDGFLLNGSYYTGMIHVVTNSLGKLKGYTIELKDDTEHYRIVELKEKYNEELSTEVENKTKRIRAIQQKTILGMAQMVESRDLSTGGHIKRTSDVVRIFAKKLVEDELELDQSFLNLVIRSAPMHDLGKIGVDDAVLRKQGRFTDEEYAMMKKHSEIGYRMVSEILSDVEEPEFVKVAENVAHYHHEKIDGTGYPTGLKGDEIPIEARIMALADVFDALVSKRCYKEAFSYDRAFDIIKKDAGTHFDKRLVDEFLKCRPQLEEYYNKAQE